MRFRLLPILITFLLLATAACETPPQINRLPSDAVVLTFGDSLTHGNGASPGEAYPDVLTSLLGRTVINAGVPGEISEEGVRRLPRLLEEHRPSLVILCHGGNDFLRRLDRTQTAANLAAMVEASRAAGADVILVGIPEFGFVLKPPPFYREIAEHFGLPYEAEVVSDLLGDRDYKSDTIHPNAAGYRRMAEAIFKVIRDAGGL